MGQIAATTKHVLKTVMFLATAIFLSKQDESDEQRKREGEQIRILNFIMVLVMVSASLLLNHLQSVLDYAEEDAAVAVAEEAAAHATAKASLLAALKVHKGAKEKLTAARAKVKEAYGKASAVQKSRGSKREEGLASGADAARRSQRDEGLASGADAARGSQREEGLASAADAVRGSQQEEIKSEESILEAADKGWNEVSIANNKAIDAKAEEEIARRALKDAKRAYLAAPPPLTGIMRLSLVESNCIRWFLGMSTMLSLGGCVNAATMINMLILVMEPIDTVSPVWHGFWVCALSVFLASSLLVHVDYFYIIKYGDMGHRLRMFVLPLFIFRLFIKDESSDQAAARQLAEAARGGDASDTEVDIE